MNFIGHLAIARALRSDPGFWLGAMLPDFSAMIGAPAFKAVRAPSALADGVALHHLTDDAFHGAPAFVALTRRVFDALLERSLPRGPARAVAHVGVELLLDGELGGDRALVHDYQQAVRWERAALSPWLDDPALAERTEEFLARLAAHGFPAEYADPAAVSRRLARILAGRPRLALAPDALDAVREVLAEVQPAIQRATPDLLAAVHSALPARSSGHNEG